MANNGNEPLYPADGVKTCKEITNSIKRIYEDYSQVYCNNFKEIKAILDNTKLLASWVNQIQIAETVKELEALYAESNTLDMDALRLRTLFERLDQLSDRGFFVRATEK